MSDARGIKLQSLATNLAAEGISVGEIKDTGFYTGGLFVSPSITVQASGTTFQVTHQFPRGKYTRSPAKSDLVSIIADIQEFLSVERAQPDMALQATSMTLDEIKAAVDAGLKVHWSSSLYKVNKYQDGYRVEHSNGFGSSLEFDGKLQGRESEFFVLP